MQRIEGLPDVVSHIAFALDGARLAVMLSNGHGLRIYARDCAWRELARDEGDYNGHGFGVDFAADGGLATTSLDGTVRLYRENIRGGTRPTAVATSTPYNPLGPNLQPMDVMFSPDGRWVAVGYGNAMFVDVLDGRTLKWVHRPDTLGIGEGGGLSSIAWSRDGYTLFAAGQPPYSGSHIVAWDQCGTGRWRVLAPSHRTVMSLLPLAGGDLLVATATPSISRLRPDGIPEWVREAPLADYRGQCELLTVSVDGLRIGFGFEAYGESPVTFDVSTQELVLAHAGDHQMVLPRQSGMPVENWKDHYGPTFEGWPFQLEPEEASRSFAIDPDCKSFVLGTEWMLRAFDAHGCSLWNYAAPSGVLGS